MALVHKLIIALTDIKHQTTDRRQQTNKKIHAHSLCEKSKATTKRLKSFEKKFQGIPHVNLHLKSFTRPKTARPAERRLAAVRGFDWVTIPWVETQARLLAPPLTREVSRMETLHKSTVQHMYIREAS